eukprot:2691403-Prorocentrum_lima.AAC.1
MPVGCGTLMSGCDMELHSNDIAQAAIYQTGSYLWQARQIQASDTAPRSLFLQLIPDMTALHKFLVSLLDFAVAAWALVP